MGDQYDKHVMVPSLGTRCVEFARDTIILAGVIGTTSLIVVVLLFLALTNPVSELPRLVVAMAVSGIGGIAGLAVISFSRGTSWGLWAPLAATPVRTVATLLGLTILLLLPEGLVTASLFLYLILFYVVILGGETFLTLRHLRKNPVLMGSAVPNDGA